MIAENYCKASTHSAHCSCAGGSGGHCYHVYALIFQLTDYSPLKVNEIPSDITCTSKPQKWHIPKATYICPVPVVATHYACSATNEKTRKRKPVTTKLCDARSEHAHTSLPRQQVMDEVSWLKSMSKPPQFSYLLADQEPSVLLNSTFRNVTIGSTLSYQRQDNGKPSTTFYSNVTACSLGEHFELI